MMTRICQSLMAFGLVLWGLNTARAEIAPRAWDIAPYRVLVWMKVDQTNLADPGFPQRLASKIENKRMATTGGTWQTRFEFAPVPLAPWFDSSAKPQPFAKLLGETNIDIEQYDRLILLEVSRPNLWQAQYKEFDCRTQSWGNLHSRKWESVSLLPTGCVKFMYDCFAPLTKIEDVEGFRVTLRTRAATLIRDEQQARRAEWNLTASPQQVASDGLTKNPDSDLQKIRVRAPQAVAISRIGEAYYPILRRNDRSGKLAEDGISYVPWTYISIDKLDDTGCQGPMYSGFSSPLPGRRNVRVERYAIAARPSGDSTLLTVAAGDRPQAGCEIYSKELGSPAELLGETDFRGMVIIPPKKEYALRVLYVRSGGNVLARLPIVPGMEPTLTAKVEDDTRRLLAEGFVTGWRDQLVDTTARRQLLAFRIKSRMEKGDLDSADRWLAELKRARTIGELGFELRSAKGQFLRGVPVQGAVKRRIDGLFDSGQKLIAADKTLALESQLTRDLAEAKLQKNRANAQK